MPCSSNSMIKTYGAFRLTDIITDKLEDWDFSGATHVRVQLPSEPDSEVEMQRRGFVLADRTLKASISLGHCKADLERYIRLPIVESLAYKEDILRIACASFSADRRFHISPKCDMNIATLILREWVNSLDSVLVCLFKEKPVGFLALRQNGQDSQFVHLAAVEKQFRISGAAMALYAKACQLTSEQGFKKLEGRFSSRNTAVMNIYATFGAIFSEPCDIFLKEIKI